jgi:hypothetical protein
MMPPEAPPLARTCLDHLRLELDSLARLHHALDAVRRALVAGDPALDEHRATIAAYHDGLA